MKRPRLLLSLLPLLAFIATAGGAQTPTLTIDAGEPVAQASRMHYGLMTEELNHAYDGGLYAELVRNRAFMDDPRNPVHWSPVPASGSTAAIALDPKQPLNGALTTSLRLDVTSASRTAPAGVANPGYWGFPITPDTRYRACFYARAAEGFSGPVTVALESEDGTAVYAQGTARRVAGDWKQYRVTLRTGEVTLTSKARLTLKVDRPGTLWLSLVSLFPPTWKDRPNGLRRDLMQMLVDLKPAFLRFPGGNYLEGQTIATRFDWKKTLGPLTERPGHPGPWGYRSSDGMGLLEFLLWTTDMGAEPVLGVYAGYSLGGEYVKPGPELEPFVQDALDEIEYVTGPVTSRWGARRAKDGHPKPFPLQYVEIGNEDWFDRSGSYDGRFAQFYDAIKARYPHLKVISTVGNEQPVEKRVRSRRPDVIDEHYYRNTAQFLRMSPSYYEKYDRKGPEIFVGEWAAHEDIVPWDPRSRSLPPTPSMKAAIGDAAFMTNMERSADLVTMQCYAPLFVNVNPGARQWRPNLIGYDAQRSYGSPSYYTLKMFSTNYGDEILRTTLSSGPLLTSATRSSRSGTIFLKHVNPESAAQMLTIELKGARVKGMALETVLAAAQDETNSIDQPTRVAPVTRRLNRITSSFSHTFPPSSITVLRFEQE